MLPFETYSPTSIPDTAMTRLIKELDATYSKARESDQDIDAWLLQPLIPRKYDLELINLFLNSFTVHVSSTFQSFSNFDISNTTTPQQILAMAAVGALFVGGEDSSTIARTLYADAARMMAAVVGQFLSKCENAVSLIRLTDLFTCRVIIYRRIESLTNGMLVLHVCFCVRS